MQLGFVIDHSRCIGCHACTVACKSENDVPLGSFRTWVKYTEAGEFPEVRRGFSVLRCNQCSEAPCVEICPTSALQKRDDGIVDLNPDRCIGCKSCMQGCPYDALYINPHSGLAEKCHFCAHRTEVGLAPACAVVCPTEAIVPGDFDDPESVVSRMRREHDLVARKTEAGTGPNVLYREVTPAGIDPGQTNISKGFIWSENPTGERFDAEAFRAADEEAKARTVYDVPRKLLWGAKITGYLWTKSIAGGALPAALLAALLAEQTDLVQSAGWGPVVISLVFLALTGGLLVADLKRPERFWYLLRYPNWSSWLVRGTYCIMAFGLVASLAALALLTGATEGVGTALLAGSAITGAATAGYTGYLFGQAKGRVLWMRRGMALHLVIQALVAGSAALLVLGFLGLGTADDLSAGLVHLLQVALGLHLAFTLVEGRLSPPGREEEYHRASRLITHGPYKVAHWGVGVVAGILLPLALVMTPELAPLAGLLVLVGLWAEEDLLVRAGQALPIS